MGPGHKGLGRTCGPVAQKSLHPNRIDRSRALLARMQSKVAMIAGSLLVSLMFVGLPASAFCVPADGGGIPPTDTMSLDSPLTGEGGDGCDGGGEPRCHSYTSDPGTGTSSSNTTECSDGFRCTANNTYNDPNNPPTTTFDPPGCGDDPRYET